MTTFSVTPFNLADLSTLLRLEKVIFPQDTFGMGEFLSLFLRGKETFLVARDGKTLAGYIAAYSEDDRAYIASIAVDLAYQRHGLGRLLMETVMETFAQAGVYIINLHVREDNEAAIHLYHSLGFIILERLSDYYEDGSNGLFMERTSAPIL